jgi:hypothetical protein
MDLVCLIDNKEAALHASDLVAMIGDLLERGQFPSFCPSIPHDKTSKTFQVVVKSGKGHGTWA